MRSQLIASALCALVSAGRATAQTSLFDDRVAPILRTRCLGCHNEQLKDGGLSFLNRDALLKGGGRGPAIVPGKPDKSLLMAAVRQEGDLKMPPGAKLSDGDIATLTQWIKRGAQWGAELHAPPSEVWRFDRIDEIGGHPTTVLGHPRVVDTPAGKAVEFNGADDAIFLDVHPLAGAEAFTWEVIFRPDPGGAPEQRFFHLQERDPKTGADTATRMLQEIRLIGGRWCLDAFALSGDASQTLIDRERLHSVAEWHHAAMVYDGRALRSYVDGVLEGSAPLHLAPQGPGHSSIASGSTGATTSEAPSLSPA